MVLDLSGLRCCVFLDHFTNQPNQRLLKESESRKAEATLLFNVKDFHNAISRYEDAMFLLPKRAYYPRAILYSNIAACHIKLEQWTDAVKSATSALDDLTTLEASETLPGDEKADSEKKEEGEEEVEEEIVSAGAEEAGPAIDPEGFADKRKADILRIRTKSLLRRARAYSNTDSWSSLSSAVSDYEALAKLPSHALTPADARTVRTQLTVLQPKVKLAQERETTEMWGKLKDLGNGLLKPFGLSTNNFQMVKDEKTGGYSMNFDQNASGA